jgi:hypothetical protein
MGDTGQAACGRPSPSGLRAVDRFGRDRPVGPKIAEDAERAERPPEFAPGSRSNPETTRERRGF